MNTRPFRAITETASLVVVTGTFVFSVYHLVKLAGALFDMAVEELVVKRLFKKN